MSAFPARHVPGRPGLLVGSVGPGMDDLLAHEVAVER
jgi:hypothetical protein